VKRLCSALASATVSRFTFAATAPEQTAERRRADWTVSTLEPSALMLASTADDEPVADGDQDDHRARRRSSARGSSARAQLVGEQAGQRDANVSVTSRAAAIVFGSSDTIWPSLSSITRSAW
jgi:hypothetical protein